MFPGSCTTITHKYVSFYMRWEPIRPFSRRYQEQVRISPTNHAVLTGPTLKFRVATSPSLMFLAVAGFFWRLSNPFMRSILWRICCILAVSLPSLCRKSKRSGYGSYYRHCFYLHYNNVQSTTEVNNHGRNVSNGSDELAPREPLRWSMLHPSQTMEKCWQCHSLS